jgi:preprotein translocase subunit YajC
MICTMWQQLWKTAVMAQEGSGPAAPAAPPAAPGPSFVEPMFMLLAVMVLLYFMMLRPSQKRERERKNMLAALKKNDHVVTAGGIKGVVANVKLEDDEVVLKVDEATGTKLRVALSSIARVVAAEEDAAAAKKES